MLHNFMKWFDCYSGFWSFLQGLGTLAALTIFGLSWRVSKLGQQHRDLDNVVAARNVTFYLARCIPDAMNSRGNPDNELWIQTVEACLKRVGEIDLSTIRPVDLSEAFIDLQILGERAAGVAKCIYLPNLIDEINTHTIDALRRIDSYLLKSHCVFNDRKIAARLRQQFFNS